MRVILFCVLIQGCMFTTDLDRFRAVELDASDASTPELDASELDSSDASTSELDASELDASDASTSELDASELDSSDASTPELDASELDASEPPEDAGDQCCGGRCSHLCPLGYVRCKVGGEWVCGFTCLTC